MVPDAHMRRGLNLKRDRCGTELSEMCTCSPLPAQVRMLYVGGAHNRHGPEFRQRARRGSILEAGWVRRMRHARGRV